MPDATLPTNSEKWRKAIPLLILAGLCAYCNSFTKAFVLDDLLWIKGPLNLDDTWSYMRLMIMRPLIGLSILLNYRLGGVNVGGYHAVNLAIHILAALTLFGIVRRTLLLERWQGRFTRSAPWLALTIALWWEVHPLTTQGVTYVIQRCESMMGLFYLLSLYCVLRGHTSPRPRWWYAGAVVSAVCSAGAKEVSATIPLVVLLFDWMFLAGSFRQLVKERWGLYVGFVLVWVTNATCLFLSPIGNEGANAGFGYGGVTPKQYLFTQSEVILYYLRLCFWPSPLCLVYRGWPLADSLREVLLPGAAVLILLLLTLWAVVRRWWPGFLGAWFFLILAPTSSIMPIADVAFEHRMYLPLMAVIALVVFSGHAFLRMVLKHVAIPESWRIVLAGGMVTGVALTLGLLTFRRNEDYRSQITIYQEAVNSFPGRFAKSGLGGALVNAGEPDKGIVWLEEVIAEEPDALALYFIGQIHGSKGNLAKANRYFSESVQRAPGKAPARNDLGVTLYYQGKPQEAVKHLRKAIELNPNMVVAHNNLAVILDALGERTAADAEYRTALRLEPSFPESANRTAREILLGDSINHGVNRQMFSSWLPRLVERGDRKPEMLDTLAMAYAANGRFDDAIVTVKKGLDIARQTNNALWLAVFPQRLKLYEKHKPFTRANAEPRPLGSRAAPAP